MVLQDSAALTWLQARVERGHGGKVLLAGFRGGSAVAAWAAGLRGPDDHANFTTFARHVLQQDACDGYWLMLPGQLQGTRGYRCRLHTRSDGRGLEAWQDSDGWGWRAITEPELLDDLLQSANRLPGILRRELDALAAELGIDPPG